MRPLLLCSLLTAALAGTGAAQTTVKVASLSPLSGPQSEIGSQARNGAQLAVNEYKARFAKLGLNLQFAAYDDQADPTTGTANARKIAADRSILAIVGPMNSGVAIPVSSALAASRVAIVSPASTANELTDRKLANTNRVVARDDAQGPAAANYIADVLKAKRVYVLNDKTAYGEGVAREVERTLRAKKVQIVGSEGTEERNNFQPLLIKIKALNPDVVYFGSIYDQAGVFIKQLRDAGITAKVMGGDGWDSSQLQTIGGKATAGVLFTTTVAPLDAIPAAKTFAANYKKTFGREAGGFSAFGYDAMRVILESILNVARSSPGKAPSRAAVERAIRNANVKNLLSGDVQFDSRGDRVGAKLYVMQIDRNLTPKVSRTLTVRTSR